MTTEAGITDQTAREPIVTLTQRLTINCDELHREALNQRAAFLSLPLCYPLNPETVG